MHSDRIRVWDPLVRLFHWGLVAAFAAGWVTQEKEYELHLAAGYTVLALVAVRILWGFVGTHHARFADFVRGPGRVTAYLAQLTRGTVPRYLGHNPAGGAMILLLIAAMLTITLSGIALDAAENRAGPLGDTTLFLYTDTIIAVHEWSTDAALALILLHVLGVIHAGFAHRENLVRAMITGDKPNGEGGTDAAGDHS